MFCEWSAKTCDLRAWARRVWLLGKVGWWCFVQWCGWGYIVRLVKLLALTTPATQPASPLEWATLAKSIYCQSATLSCLFIGFTHFLVLRLASPLSCLWFSRLYPPQVSIASTSAKRNLFESFQYPTYKQYNLHGSWYLMSSRLSHWHGPQ